MKSGSGILLAIAFSAAAAFGQGTILWDEAVDGPLANDFNRPTPLGVLRIGTNSVLAAAQFVRTGEGPGGTLCDDYMVFAVEVGQFISATLAKSDNPVLLWLGDGGFGSELAVGNSSASEALMLQPTLSVVSSGTYGFYVSNRQFNAPASVANYRLDFVVEAVPEPASLCLLLGGLGWLGIRAWKCARSNN